MNINLGNATVAGEFKVVLKNKDGEVTKETPWNNNLLTDRFFSLTSASSWMYGFVGTGSTPPAATDTKLASLIGSASSSAHNNTSGSDAVQADTNNGPTLTTRSYIFRWALGAIVGNISEWGWSESSSTSTYLLNVRSLIKDTNGNPTTITVTAGDQLEIWWRLKKKAPGAIQMAAAESTQTIMLNGVSTQVKCTAVNPDKQQIATSARELTVITGLSIKTLVANTAEAITLRDAAAGVTLTSSSQLATEQSVLGISESKNSPAPGVLKVTWTATFPLFTGAGSDPIQCIVGDNYSTGIIIPYSVLVKLTFNPQFTKGVDKILTVSFSYTVTRA